MLKIFAMPSRSADPGKQYGRKKLHQKDWTQNTENPVGQSTSCESYWKKKKKLPPSIPLRFLSLLICTDATLGKELQTSHIMGKNDSKSIPLAKF